MKITEIKNYQVAEVACETVHVVLTYGDMKGKSGWEEQGIDHSIGRALAHLEEHRKGNKRSSAHRACDRTPHLHHALTRIAMAIALEDYRSKYEQGGTK